MALDKLQRYAEGESDWDKYVGLNAPEEKTSLLTNRWKRLLRQGMVSEAIERLAQLTQLPSEDPTSVVRIRLRLFTWRKIDYRPVIKSMPTGRWNC